VPIEDNSGIWHPAGDRLTVTRRYFDERMTPGAQIYEIDMESLEATPLVVDETYHHSALEWNADGRWLVMERFNREEPGATPEIWVYDVGNDALMLVQEDAWMPGFLP